MYSKQKVKKRIIFKHDKNQENNKNASTLFIDNVLLC